jgi:hypothetical protein
MTLSLIDFILGKNIFFPNIKSINSLVYSVNKKNKIKLIYSNISTKKIEFFF